MAGRRYLRMSCNLPPGDERMVVTATGTVARMCRLTPWRISSGPEVLRADRGYISDDLDGTGSEEGPTGVVNSSQQPFLLIVERYRQSAVGERS